MQKLEKQQEFFASWLHEIAVRFGDENRQTTRVFKWIGQKNIPYSCSVTAEVTTRLLLDVISITCRLLMQKVDMSCFSICHDRQLLFLSSHIDPDLYVALSQPTTFPFSTFLPLTARFTHTLLDNIQHSTLPQIFPPIDSLPASGLTPRTSRLDRFFWASPFYVFSFFIILFCLVPCGRLSWLLVSFWAHVNIVLHIISYHKN